MKQTIVPAWIRKHDATGVWAILGSEPKADAAEVFVPADRVENVVMHVQEVNGRKFGIIIIKERDTE